MSNLVYGQPMRLDIDVDVPTTPESRDTRGSELWRLGMFTSRNPQGEGPRSNYQTQLLDPYYRAQPLQGGTSLMFNNIPINFRPEELGCSEENYLCFEFTKGSMANPDFKFEVESGGDTLVSCQEQICKGKGHSCHLIPIFWGKMCDMVCSK